jgi:hypothetical protein
MHSLTKLSTLALVCGALALGGCASTDDMKKAQSSADQANQQAQAASAAAQRAQASADQAQSEVQALNAKFDSMVAEEHHEGARHVRHEHEEAEHRHKHHHHRKHH